MKRKRFVLKLLWEEMCSVYLGRERGMMCSEWIFGKTDLATGLGRMDWTVRRCKMRRAVRSAPT